MRFMNGLKVFASCFLLAVLGAMPLVPVPTQAQSERFVLDELLVKFQAGTSRSSVDRINTQMGASVITSKPANGYHVKTGQRS
jgi:hypothetical protein